MRMHLFTFVWIYSSFPQEILDPYFDTYPARKYLKTYTKYDEQEAALTKAVVEAKVKTASTLWKEVVVQMKHSTGEDFAPSSLRKRYEEIERKQFFISEQDPTKYNQWPPLPRVINGRRVNFDNTPELVPVAIEAYDMGDHAHGQNGGSRSMSAELANDSLLTDKSAEDAGYESFDTANGNHRSMIASKGKDGSSKSKSRLALEKENESPSHTHPRVSYRKVGSTTDLARSGSASTSTIQSTPTPAVASKGKGIAGLIGYEGSDDSE
jgi:hypothetical protein